MTLKNTTTTVRLSRSDWIKIGIVVLTAIIYNERRIATIENAQESTNEKIASHQKQSDQRWADFKTDTKSQFDEVKGLIRRLEDLQLER